MTAGDGRRRRAGGTAAGGFALLAAAATLIGVGGAAAPGEGAGPGERSGPRLERLAQELAAWRRTRAPHAAARPETRSDPVPLVGVTATALARDLAWLRDFRRRLDALPRPPAGEQTAEAALDRELLEAALDRELLEAEILRPFERDPGAYVTLVTGPVEAALDRSVGSACARSQRAARRLAEVPEVLRTARINLRDPPRAFTELAIERFESVLRFYREEVPRLATGCRNARLQADLAQADSTAVRAVASFLSYLREDLLPASRGEPAIGPEASRRLLRAATLSEVAPIESLLAEGLRRVEARRLELDDRLAQTGEGGRDVLARLRAEPDTSAGVQAGIARMLEFLRARRVVTLPAGLALRAHAAPAFRAGPEPRLADMGRGGEPAGPGRLEVTAAGSAAGGAAWLSRWEIDLAVAREGLPGRHLRLAVLADLASATRRGLLESWPGGDWGRYCERLVIEEGFGGDDPRYRLAGAVRGLHEAGLSLAALALHSGAMPPEAARRVLVERCLMDDDQADRAMRSAAADPALMGYSLGAQRLRELQDEARRRLGPRYRTRAFLDAVLRCGASPVGVLRDRLWRELAEATGNDPVGAQP